MNHRKEGETWAKGWRTAQRKKRHPPTATEQLTRNMKRKVRNLHTKLTRKNVRRREGGGGTKTDQLVGPAKGALKKTGGNCESLKGEAQASLTGKIKEAAKTLSSTG